MKLGALFHRCYNALHQKSGVKVSYRHDRGEKRLHHALKQNIRNEQILRG